MAMPVQLCEAKVQPSPTPATTSSPILNLESQLRSMILSNGVPSQSSVRKAQMGDKQARSLDTLPPHIRTASLSEEKEYASKQREISSSTAFPKHSYKKPNQAQRRKLRLNHEIPYTSSPNTLPGADESTAVVSDTSSTSDPKISRHSLDTTNQPSRTTQPHPSNFKASRSDGSQPRQLPRHTPFNFKPPDRENPTLQSYNGVHQPGLTSSRMSMPLPHKHPPRPYPHPSQTTQNRSPPEVFAGRPHPSYNRQLFNPRFNSQPDTQPHQVPPSRFHHRFATVNEQVKYLDELAYVEVQRAEISSDDLKAKELLRVTLEKICRSSIGAFERTKDQTFDPSTVGLKCFGSLSSGFATYSSDMDLALVSPASKPDTASAGSQIPRLLEKALLDLGYGARLLIKTRVPIIKFCEKPTPQLLEALLKERSKWENSKSLPLKSKKVKETKSVEKDGNTEKSKKSKKPRKLRKVKISQEGETPEVRRVKRAKEPNKVRNAKSVVEDDKSPQTTELRTESHTETSTETSLNGDTLSIPESTRSKITKDSEEDADENLSEEVEDSESSKEHAQLGNNGEGEILLTDGVRDKLPRDTDERDTSKSIDGKVVMENTNGKEAQADIEITEDKPPIRSDKELVRLYKLAIMEGWFNDEERAIISRFVKAVEWPSVGQTCPDLVDARAALQSLPDVLKRYRDKQNELDFPKTGVGIQCDINFSNPLALHNTHLLRCYSHCDPRIRPMVLFVKAWAKRRKINNPYTGTLSSYGYVLMVLHFVVNIVEPPLAPNLQLSGRAPPAFLNPKESEVNGYKVHFWRSEKEIRDCAARGTLTQNREPIGSLLRNFFQYFAMQGQHVIRGGFSWTTDVLSLRSYNGILSKADKGWTGAKTTTIEPATPGQESKEVKHRYLFAIEDPFEIDHNIARTVIHNGIVAIRDEFRRANRIIQHAGFEGGMPVYLFEEAKGMVSPRTFFGPHPRPEFGPQNLAEELRPVVVADPPTAKPQDELVGYLSPASDAVSDDVCESVDRLKLDDGSEAVDVGSKSEPLEGST